MISRFSSVNNNKQATPKNLKQNDKNSNPSFKGPIDMAVQAGTQTLNYLNTSPAVGACFVDFFSMVLPRTLVDLGRSPDAAMETGFRESSGTVNHALAGFAGLGAGYLVAKAFNNANGVKIHHVFTDNDAIDTMSEFVKQHTSKGKVRNENYYKNLAKNMAFFNTTNGASKSMTGVSDEAAEAFAKVMANAPTDKYKPSSEILKDAQYALVSEKGAASTVELTNPETGKKVIDSLENHIKNAFSVGKAFEDKAANDAKQLAKQVKDSKFVPKILTNAEFVDAIKGLKTKTAIAGLAVPVAIGMSIQPLNRYLTKKRTGKDGFVGVEGREPDKSTGFKFAKLGLGLAMGSLMISTILPKSKTLFTHPLQAAPKILSELKFKGIVPTINQFKFIYGVTIMSRIFAVRDKNEMRESAIKDSLGFANWLILGGFVSKLASKGFSKLLNKKGIEGIVNCEKENMGKFGSFIKNSVEKTHEEILYPALKAAGIPVVKDGKAVPFRTLMSQLAQKAKAEGADKNVVKAYEAASARLKYKNRSQLLGYIYSGVVLGLGISKLNIAVTKMCEGKNKKNVAPVNDKMKISNEFIKRSVQNDSKAFGAFVNQI